MTFSKKKNPNTQKADSVCPLEDETPCVCPTENDPKQSDSSDSGAASLSSSQPSMSDDMNKLSDIVKVESNEEKLKHDIDANSAIKEQNALRTLVTLQDRKIHEFVTNGIKHAILVENVGSEMTYSISNKIEHTKNYERFFGQIENKLDELGNGLVFWTN